MSFNGHFARLSLLEQFNRCVLGIQWKSNLNEHSGNVMSSLTFFLAIIIFTQILWMGFAKLKDPDYSTIGISDISWLDSHYPWIFNWMEDRSTITGVFCSTKAWLFRLNNLRLLPGPQLILQVLIRFFALPGKILGDGIHLWSSNRHQTPPIPQGSIQGLTCRGQLPFFRGRNFKATEMVTKGQNYSDTIQEDEETKQEFYTVILLLACYAPLTGPWKMHLGSGFSQRWSKRTGKDVMSWKTQTTSKGRSKDIWSVPKIRDLKFA